MMLWISCNLDKNQIEEKYPILYKNFMLGSKNSTTPSLPADCCSVGDRHCAMISDLAQLPIFKNLSADILDTIAVQHTTLHVVRGQTLFLQDDPADSVFVIRSGWVKLFRETLDGQEAIIDVLSNGHIFGDSALFNENIHQYGAQVVEDGIVWRIPIHIFQNLLGENKDFTFNLVKHMAQFRREHEKEVEHRSLQNASQRIGCFLLRLLPNLPAEGAHTIQIPYDKLLVAGRLGMKPETLSRGLARLKEDLNITVKGGTVHVPNIATLIEYTCSACTHSFPCEDLCHPA